MARLSFPFGRVIPKKWVFVCVREMWIYWQNPEKESIEHRSADHRQQIGRWCRTAILVNPVIFCSSADARSISGSGDFSQLCGYLRLSTSGPLFLILVPLFFFPLPLFCQSRLFIGPSWLLCSPCFVLKWVFPSYLLSQHASIDPINLLLWILICLTPPTQT